MSSGPVAILWDIENCRVPSDTRPEDVAGNIRMALRVHPVINGAVMAFCAYGDFSSFSRRLREGCQRTGIKLIDIPNGRKDAADKAILVDMFLFALDNPPPSSLILISGDGDFAPALHTLGQRGYTVVIIVPSGFAVSSALCNAGNFVLDWPSVARGEGFVPLSTKIAMNCCNFDHHNCKNNGCSHNRYCPRDLLQPSNPAFIGVDGLKARMVKLLQLSGGGLPVSQIHQDYQQMYGQPLQVAGFGGLKLADLLKKMSDVVRVEGRGNKKVVCLKAQSSVSSSLSRPTVALQEESAETATVCNRACTSGLSDEERGMSKLEQFKQELQEIMVSYPCGIFLVRFEDLYQQRYKKPLDHRQFGVDRLEDLFDMVGDVVVLDEEHNKSCASA